MYLEKTIERIQILSKQSIFWANLITSKEITFNGKRLKRDLPFEASVPFGIFQAFNLYEIPCEEKKSTWLCELPDKILMTKSSSLVVIPVFPFPPLF